MPFILSIGGISNSIIYCTHQVDEYHKKAAKTRQPADLRCFFHFIDSERMVFSSK